jgi:Ca-activated chloride channel family protein
MRFILKKSMFQRLLLTALSIVFVTSILSGQVTMPKKYVPPETRILFVFDASQSMLGVMQKERKIDLAKRVLISIIDSLQNLDNIQMALRAYGFQSIVPPQDCNDTKLIVPFAKGNASKIRQELRYLTPKGTTPIAHSLELAGSDFPEECVDCRNIIILITDGIEACEGDPCAVSYELQKKGVVLKPFVLGIGIDEGFKETFDCIGHYYNANDEEKFAEVMNVVISQALNSTTAQVNLLDKFGLPTETNVNMTFIDHFSGKIIQNYMHTMNYRGVPDTLILDHLITYDLKVNTIPPVYVNEIKLSPGKHTVIAADCPQGTLVVKVEGGSQYRGLQYIVRKSGKMETLTMQEVNNEENYLIGKYDLEIPVLPRILLNNVEISQSTTTTITIPKPGMLNLIKSAPGYGSIYLRKAFNDEEWICNFNNSIKNETVVLQPGKYRIVFRVQNSKQTINTINKVIEIKPGAAETIQLY